MKHPGKPTDAPDWYRPRPPTAIEDNFSRAATALAGAIEAERWFGDSEKHHRYRVDFLLQDAKLIIELDGHDHHSSKDQLENDAKRQRYLTRCGYTIIRFTGREIYRNVEKCVSEVSTIYRERLARLPVRYRSFYVDYNFLCQGIRRACREFCIRNPGEGITPPDPIDVILKALDWLHERSFVSVFIFAAHDDADQLASLDGRKYEFDKGEVRVSSELCEFYAWDLAEHLEAYTHLYDDISLMGDDRAYIPPLLPLFGPQLGKFIRLDNHSTSFLGTDLVKVRWQDIDYVVMDAAGVAWHLYT